ncbi:MAG: glucose-1-phosphate cytidylyltransferase [Crocinitomicaceae bacterium]|nr:glucose-1-phosphate cytidylyltransferase [Crocinitomicaceae bacterium]
MKVVIFAGGLGTRLAEETGTRPKPMVEIGGKPILWHIMKIYEHYGFNEFIICLGYKGYMIKEYFMHYYLHNSDLTISVDKNDVKVHYNKSESFKVTLVDTGDKTMTAGRLNRVKPYIDDETFMLTYGDGLSDVNLKDLLHFHYEHGKLATLTAIQPEARFGGMEIQENGEVSKFKEKPKGDGAWINGGFFVLNRKIFNYIDHPDIDTVMWEDMPIEELTKANELMAFKHEGFWKCMDAMRDKIELERIWSSNNPKWKLWD